MENNRQYWKGLEELHQDPEFVNRKNDEFMEGLPLDEVFNENSSTFGLASNRRDFLKYMGFGVSAVALAACNTAPVKNAIPYVVKPETITPGVPNYYASTCASCSASCGILVKTREGRPIKIDGNPNTFNKGAVCAIGQASVLTLYDNNRLKQPYLDGKPSQWDKVDPAIKSGLESASASGKKIAVVMSSSSSPSTKRALEELTKKYKGTQIISFDALSYNGMLLANEKSFGKRVIPAYDFSKANVIVSLGADFLGTWLSPTEFTKQWVVNRKLNQKEEMSRHFQFETHLSVSGSNADVRVPLKPSQMGLAVATLYNEVAKLKSIEQVSAPAFDVALSMIANAAKELVASEGKSLVVCGSNDPDIQMMVNAINMMIGSYGQTIDITNQSNQYQGVDADMDTLVADMNNGTVGAVILHDVNPLYSYHKAAELKSALVKVELTVSTSYSMDETAQAVKIIAPSNHYLESWNDHEPKAGQLQLQQPTITRVFNTRQFQENILIWVGIETDYYSFIKETWKGVFEGNFVAGWNQALHDGFYMKPAQTPTVPTLQTKASDLGKSLTPAGSGLEVHMYVKVGIGDGSQSNNPWLQELPDPISKVCWDNYAAINKATADKLKVKDGDTIDIKTSSFTLTAVPVLIQPGQVRDTISIAVGYGRTAKIGNIGGKVGKNAFGFLSSTNGSVRYAQEGVSVSKNAASYSLAQTQTHHTIEGRSILKETTLDRYKTDPRSGNHNYAHIVSLWEEHDYKGHRWAMAIDLNACTGCGTCVVACQAENNVAVVGREEILKGREMHWMRIDRYYSFNGKSGDRQTREKKIATDVSDWENVSVGFQPLMCQHCAHAPCETVCPVLATTHSSEGLNQMTYNRCIGTKYCANNCPYKVRRFNWFKLHDNDKFDFNMNNDLGRMVLNPDVTVRSRGVMEKCSFCVQRIQEGKLKAKRENRSMSDGDIKTACQVACPADAIVFGDRNDPNSAISKLFYNEREYQLMTDDEKKKVGHLYEEASKNMTPTEKRNVQRAFALLEEINVKPSVKYFTKVRNRLADSVEHKGLNSEIKEDLKLAHEMELKHEHEAHKKGHAKGHGHQEENKGHH